MYPHQKNMYCLPMAEFKQKVDSIMDNVFIY